MTLFGLRFFAACAALTMVGGTANAALYGKVEGDRISILYSDVPPADKSYKLYSRNNRFIVHPGALKKQPRYAPMPAQAYAPRPAPSTYDRHIQSAAAETNVDPALIRAVISVESGYNPHARSHAGAVGLMQLMPKTAMRYGVKDSRDPAQNIHGGARYLRDLQVMFDNNLQLVLAAYNAGEFAVMKYGRRIPPYRETVAYVPKVLSYYKKFRAATPATPPG